MRGGAAYRCAVGLLLSTLASAAVAQTAKTARPGDFPDRPLRLVTGFPPGGVSDTLARILGVQLGEQMNQRIVVDARPGAGGMLAMELTANATPDGYTIYLAQPGVVISRLSRNKPSVDPLVALAPVGMLGTSPTVLVVNPSLPVNNIKELIAYANSRPDGLFFGSSGTGTGNHLSGELLRVAGNAKLVHVAYKGASANTVAVLQGEIPIAFQPLAGAIPHLKAGRLKGLAVTGSKRSPAVPDLPTVGETIKGYAVDSWYGFVAPVKTPKAVIDYLNQQTNIVLARPDMIDTLSRNGVDAEGSTPAAFGQLMRDEAVRWEKLVKAAGIKLD